MRAEAVWEVLDCSFSLRHGLKIICGHGCHTVKGLNRDATVAADFRKAKIPHRHAGGHFPGLIWKWIGLKDRGAGSIPAFDCRWYSPDVYIMLLCTSWLE